MPGDGRKEIIMEGDYMRYHVVLGQRGDLHKFWNRIQANREDAIVIDDNQEGMVDIWAGGEHISAAYSEAEAADILTRYRSKHPKR
jgi:hypothetical protein